MTRIIDLTVPIREGMPIYDGNPGIHLSRAASTEDGADANVSRLDLGVHTGTHADAPVHFLPDGAGAEALPLDVLVGPADVVDATTLTGPIDARSLGSLDLPDGLVRLLLKTPNSELWSSNEFTRNFIRLTGDGARFLVERGIRLVGIDYLSIGNQEAHRELLGAGVVAVEGLDFRGVDPGAYTLVCLPLRLVGSDGAPARVILLQD